MLPSCKGTSSQLTLGRSKAGKKSFRFHSGLEPGTVCFSIMVLDHPTTSWLPAMNHTLVKLPAAGTILTCFLCFLPSELLHGPFVEAVSTQAVRSMPNSFLPAAPVLQPGALVLGDAFNMRHPLTGAGMTVALHDVEFWRDELKQLADLHDVEAVLAIQRRFHWQRKMSHSFVANTLAQALYALFAAGDDGKRVQACAQ